MYADMKADVVVNMNQVDLSDELWSPFPVDENQFFYLTADPTSTELVTTIGEEDEDAPALTLDIKLRLGEILNIHSRTRYNFWDLLGDVGGFNDGLVLLCSLLMAPYSEFAFKSDYFKTSSIDSDSTSESATATTFTKSVKYLSIV